jgi:SAM-dependent methyltransferase
MLDNYIDINRDAYDKLCDDGYYDKVEYDNTEISCDRVYSQYCKINNGSKPLNVLELGPGIGRALHYFSTVYNCNTTAIELSQKMAIKAKRMAPSANIIVCDVKDINILIHSQFDIIYANAFIHLFPEQDALFVLQNYSKLLKDSGLIYLSTTINQEYKVGIFRKMNLKVERFRVFYTEPKIIELVTNCNLSIIDKWIMTEPTRKQEWIYVICQKNYV